MCGILVSTIAIVRFIAVKYPLYMIRSKVLFCFIITAFLFFSIRVLMDALSDYLRWCPMYEYSDIYDSVKVDTMVIVGGIAIYMGIYIIGGISSVGTIILVVIRKIQRKSLTQNTESTNNAEIVKDGIRISSMVFFTNILAPILQLAFIIKFENCNSNNYLIQVLSILTVSVYPICSSAIDPFIVILFSNETKKILKEKFRL